MENEVVNLESGILQSASDAVISEKIKAYNEVIAIFVDIVMDKPQGKGAIKTLGKRFSTVGIRLFAIAPDEIVTAFLKWRTLATGNENAEQTVKSYAELLLAIRRDIVPETKHDIEVAMDLWG